MVLEGGKGIMISILNFSGGENAYGKKIDRDLRGSYFFGSIQSKSAKSSKEFST